MAIALVSAGTVASGTTSVSPTFGQATTAGNLLIAWVWTDGTITTPTGWTRTAQSFVASAAIYYLANCSASTTAPTFTATGTTMFAVLAEFSGAATSSPEETGGQASGSTSPITATDGAADAAVGNLVVACCHDSLSKAGTTTTATTFNSGVTSNDVGNNDATSTTTHYRFSWGTTNSNSAADNCQHSDSSMNISTGGLVLSLASFKAAASLVIPRILAVSQAVNRAAVI